MFENTPIDDLPRLVAAASFAARLETDENGVSPSIVRALSVFRSRLRRGETADDIKRSVLAIGDHLTINGYVPGSPIRDELFALFSLLIDAAAEDVASPNLRVVG